MLLGRKPGFIDSESAFMTWRRERGAAVMFVSPEMWTAVHLMLVWGRMRKNPRERKELQTRRSRKDPSERKFEASGEV